MRSLGNSRTRPVSAWIRHLRGSFPRFPSSIVSTTGICRMLPITPSCPTFIQLPRSSQQASPLPSQRSSGRRRPLIGFQVRGYRRPIEVAKQYRCLQSGSGIAPPIFLEGPTTDTNGNLFVVDVGQGRILRCRIESGEWELVIDYDGEPNGLTLDREGRLLVADYKNGIVSE